MKHDGENEDEKYLASDDIAMTLYHQRDGQSAQVHAESP